MTKSITKKNFLLTKIAAALLLCFLFPGFVSCSGAKYKLNKNNLQITTSDGNVVSVNAELAVSQEERNYGFMNRKSIPDGTGMLFIFEKDQVLRFWMKDTPTPLSIAYIDSTGVIRDIFDMTPFSLADVTSSRSVRYALEVPQGWFDTVGIKVGDTVKTENGSPLSSLYN